MKLEQENINSIAKYLQNTSVLKAYLFGSYVRGEGTSTSDIDILVELDYSQKTGLGFIQMKFDLEELLQKKVDLVTTGGLSKYMAPIIHQQKQLIYGRRP